MDAWLIALSTLVLVALAALIVTATLSEASRGGSRSDATSRSKVLRYVVRGWNPGNALAILPLLNQDELTQVAMQARDRYVRKDAVLRLVDRDALQHIALYDAELTVRLSAASRLEELTAPSGLSEKGTQRPRRFSGIFRRGR
jgi:flagellar basal body-associated protein FliL